MAGLSWLTVDEPPPTELWPDRPLSIVSQVRDITAGLLRGLLLAGYRPLRMDVVRVGFTPDTLSYDDVSLTVSAGPLPELTPMPAVGAGVVLAFTDLFHERALMAAGDNAQRSDFSHALTVTASDAAPWAGLTADGDRQIVLWSEKDFWSVEWREDIITDAGKITEDLITALRARADAGDVTPLSRAGLLWLHNPLFWFGTDTTFPLGWVPVPSKDDFPLGPQPWPQAAGAASLDPFAVPRPADPHLSLMIGVAGHALEALQRYTSSVLRGLCFADPGNRGTLQDVLLWLERLLPNLRMRDFWGAVKALGVDEAMADAVPSRSWHDVLMMLADRGVLTPAGYPLDTVVVAGPDEVTDEWEPDPVEATWFRDDMTREYVMLAVAGINALQVYKTGLCTVELMQAFTWDYVAPEEGRLLRLIIVAGPGVEVDVLRDRDMAWTLEVIRVWSYSPVLPQGTRVQPEALLAPYPRTWKPDRPENYRDTNGMPMYGLMVYPLPLGLVLEYPMPTSAEQRPDWRLTLTVPELDGHSAIAYDVQYCSLDEPYEGDIAVDDEPKVAAITVWVSKDVTVKLERLEGTMQNRPDSDLSVWKFDDPKLVPHQGTTLPLPSLTGYIPPTTGPDLLEPDVELPETGAARVEFPSDEGVTGWFNMILLGADIGIGMIPVVGDIVDVVELAQSLYTMKDKWGRPVNLYDQMLMLFACTVPYVSSSAMRAGGDAVGFALDLSKGANFTLLDYLNSLLSLSNADKQLLDLAETSKTFLRFDNQRKREVLNLLADLAKYRSLAQHLGEQVGERLAENSPMAVVDLLTHRQPIEFWMPGLQASYGPWRKRHPFGTDDDAIQLWIAQSSGVERALLEALIGNPANAWMRAAELVRRSPRLSDHWPCTGPMAKRLPARLPPSGADGWHYDGRNSRLDIMDAARNIENIINGKFRHLDFAKRTDLPVLADRVEQLLTRLDPTRGLEEALEPKTFSRLLLGQNRNISPDDLAELLMRGMVEADRHIVNVALDSGQAVTLEKYLTIQGCESYFKDLLTHGGFMYSSNMEVIAAMEEYARLAMIVAEPAKWFSLQTFIGSAKLGVKGPDMVRHIDAMGQIVDSKSYGKIWKLLDHEARSAAANQVFRWVDALHTADPAKRLVLRFPDGNIMKPHPEMIIRVDPTQYANLIAGQHAALLRMVDLEERAENMAYVLNQQLEDYCRKQKLPVYRVKIVTTALYL